LYILVSISAVSAVPYQHLSDQSRGTPFAQVTRVAATWLPAWTFDAITMFAVANTALINAIMGSRLLYGMSRQGLLPAALGRVHPRRHTPHVAIFVLMLLVLVLTLVGGGWATGVRQLASATSLLLLASFCVVNVALVVLKRRPGEPRGTFEVPSIVPILGLLVCAALIAWRLFGPSAGGARWRAPVIAGGIIALILVLYAVGRTRAVTEQTWLTAEHDRPDDGASS
jgi:amino acid transporter